MRMSAADYVAMHGQGKPNGQTAKYGNKKTRGRDGRLYDSKKEARRADVLMGQKLNGEILGYVPQVSIPVGRDEGEKYVRYTVDFMITALDQSVRWEDVKGRDTDASRARRAALREHGINVELV